MIQFIIKENRKNLVWLGLILILAIYFNFSGITQRGLINWDEAYYLTYAQFGVSATKNLPFLVKQLRQSNLNIAAIEERLEGRPPETAKPGHVALMSIFGLLTGGIKDYTGSLFSAIFGVLTVLLVYLVGKKFYGNSAGLVSAAIISVSPYFLMYSRSAMPETDASFFLLLAILFYYYAAKNTNKPWLLYLSGLIFGFSITINYRWAFMYPLIFLFESSLNIKCIRNRDYLKFCNRLLILFAGVITMPVLFQLPYTFVNFFKAIPYPSYWNMLFSKYFLDPSNFAGPFLYPHTLFVRLLWDLMGTFGFMALAGGVVFFLIRRKLEHLLILFPFVIPFIAFSLKTRGDKAVALSIAIPFIALICGNFLCVLTKRFSPTKIKKHTAIANPILAILILLVLIPQFLQSKQLIQIKSGYRNALNWIIEHGGEKHYSSARSILNFYVGGRDRVVPLPNDLNEIREFEKRGYRYLLLDWRERKTNQIEIDIKNKLKPVFCVENKPMTFWPYIVDDFHYRHDDPDFIDNVTNSALDKILIYDISNFLN